MPCQSLHWRLIDSLHFAWRRWMAPEVLAGKSYDCAADVFSFGIILWELLTWRIPWEDLGPWQVQIPPILLHCTQVLPVVMCTTHLADQEKMHDMLLYRRDSLERACGRTQVCSFFVLLRARHSVSERPHYKSGANNDCRAWQVVILVVDQMQRPELPADPAQLPGRPMRHISTYLDLMCQCWHQDPLQRPTFDRVISLLRRVSSYLPCSTACEMQRSMLSIYGSTNPGNSWTRQLFLTAKQECTDTTA